MEVIIDAIRQEVIRVLHEEEETSYALAFLYLNKLGLEEFDNADTKRFREILNRLMEDTNKHHRMLESVLDLMQADETNKEEPS